MTCKKLSRNMSIICGATQRSMGYECLQYGAGREELGNYISNYHSKIGERFEGQGKFD